MWGNDHSWYVSVLAAQEDTSRRGNLQGGGKVFLAGRIGYVAARKRGSEHGPLEELKGFCVAGA